MGARLNLALYYKKGKIRAHYTSHFESPKINCINEVVVSEREQVNVRCSPRVMPYLYMQVVTHELCKISQLVIGASSPYLAVDLLIKMSTKFLKTRKGSESHPLEKRGPEYARFKE